MNAKDIKHPTIPDPSGQELKVTTVAIDHTAGKGTFITVSLSPGAARAVAWALFGAGGWAVWLVSLAN